MVYVACIFIGALAAFVVLALCNISGKTDDFNELLHSLHPTIDTVKFDQPINCGKDDVVIISRKLTEHGIEVTARLEKAQKENELG